MKMHSRFISMLLVMLLLVQLFAIVPTMASAEAAGDLYYIVPDVSDGITLDDAQLEQLYVKGYVDGENFVFTENKTLNFTATFGEGWSYNESYSHIFENDKTNRTINSKGSVLDITYNAKSGSKIAFSDLQNVIINATAAQLPKLYIDIDGSFNNVTKGNYVDAKFKLELGTKKYASGNYEGTGEIKGRGNSSWGMPQKPYTIKLKSKASLLDIPKTKKYAIVASYQDPSRMRSLMTYKTGLGLDGIEYTPKCEFVDVYLNGSYNGVYMLVERIDFESTKIDLDEATDDNITGGYLFEKDAGDKVNKNEDAWFKAPYQANPNEDLFTFKAPDPPTEEMIQYISNHIQKLHDALMGKSDEDYQKYIDISTWVDFLIIQELAKNIDGNLKTSCYFYKEADNDLVYMTALWDFDYAYGLAGYNNASSNNDRWDCPNGNTTDRFMVINSSCPWFKTLYTKEAFRNLLVERYTSYRQDLIPDMLKCIDEQAAYLNTSIPADAKKWSGKGDFTNGVKSLKTWLNGRIDWLDTQWLDDVEETHNVTVNYDAEQGSVAANDGTATVVDGTTKTYEIKANTGFEVATVKFNGIDVTALLNGTTFTTPIITDDATIDVEFAPVEIAVAVTPDTVNVGAKDKFTITVKTPADVTSVALKNENGKYLSRSMQSVVDPSGNFITWTITTSIGTKGMGRVITICTKTNDVFVDSDATFVANVFATTPPTSDTNKPALVGATTIPTDKIAYATNAKITLTITTNKAVNRIKLVSESGRTLSKVSETYVVNSDGTLTWTVVTSLGTKGTGRYINVALIGNDGTVTDTLARTADLYIYRP